MGWGEYFGTYFSRNRSKATSSVFIIFYFFLPESTRKINIVSCYFRQRNLVLGSQQCICASKVSVPRTTEVFGFCGTTFSVCVYIYLYIKGAMPDTSFYKGYLGVRLQLYIVPRETEMQWGVYLIPLHLTGFLPEDFA